LSDPDKFRLKIFGGGGNLNPTFTDRLNSNRPFVSMTSTFGVLHIKDTSRSCCYEESETLRSGNRRLGLLDGLIVDAFRNQQIFFFGEGN